MAARLALGFGIADDDVAGWLESSRARDPPPRHVAEDMSPIRPDEF